MRWGPPGQGFLPGKLPLDAQANFDGKTDQCKIQPIRASDRLCERAGAPFALHAVVRLHTRDFVACQKPECDCAALFKRHVVRPLVDLTQNCGRAHIPTTRRQTVSPPMSSQPIMRNEQPEDPRS